MQARIQDHWLSAGVTIADPRNTYIDGRATIGRDTVIHPFTVISGQVKIGAGCQVGPFSHLRDGTVLEDKVEVGAFVEISRSHIASGTIARHLAYLGNASVGRDVNVGAGTITANFDGSRKHESQIGDRVRIGAGAVMVAPVTIENDAVIGAGAVITRGKNVKRGETVVGVPARPLRARNDDR
jgi:bifunctional UDP-N-acetylglucosamine pyrophosphorylase/glucosamine-1-phosphate N-acetyltransferase